MYCDQNSSKDANCSYNKSQSTSAAQQQNVQISAGNPYNNNNNLASSSSSSQKCAQHQINCISYSTTTTTTTNNCPNSIPTSSNNLQNQNLNLNQSSSLINVNIKVEQQQHHNSDVDDVEPEIDSGMIELTKKGTPRLRRKFDQTPAERKAEKLRKKIEDHRLLAAPCNDRCKFKCKSLISEAQRENINSKFWKLNYDERRTFVLYSCIRMDVRNPSLQRTRNRLNTFKYHLKDENESYHNVCKAFFLATLGFKRSNDTFIFKVLSETPKGQLKPLPTKRKPSRKPYPFHNVVDQHINSFNPTMPEHRRRNSPNITGYLPATLNAVMMHRDFRGKYPDVPVSYQWYRNRLKARRIVFSGTVVRSLVQSESRQFSNNNNSMSGNNQGYEQGQGQQIQPEQTLHPQQQQQPEMEIYSDSVDIKPITFTSMSLPHPMATSVEHSTELLSVPETKAENIDSIVNDEDLEPEPELNLAPLSPTLLCPDQLTKKGTPRMRRKFALTVMERMLLKAKRKAELHPVQQPCTGSCKFECCNYFDEERRHTINRQFWEMSVFDRKAFVLFSCERCPIKRRYTKPGQRKRDRDLTLRYYLKDGQDRMHRVCKVFFLTTLGFKSRNDKFVYSVLTNTPRGELTPVPGSNNNNQSSSRATPHHKQTPEVEKEVRLRLIELHIESYNPRLPAYLHRKAPKICGYLPNNLTVTSMFRDFKRKHTGSKVHYQLYLKHFKELKYSFMPASSKQRSNVVRHQASPSLSSISLPRNKSQLILATGSCESLHEDQQPTTIIIHNNNDDIIVETKPVIIQEQSSNVENLDNSSGENFLNARLILENLT